MIVISNNDVIFEPSWYNNIHTAISWADLGSASPFCPDYSMRFLKEKPAKQISIGYEINKHLFGYCIVAKKEVYDAIGELDETFNFFSQDNDYAAQIQKHGFKHGLVSTSIVRHLAHQSHALLDEKQKQDMIFGGWDKFTKKYRNA